jgi:hypothetical protein
MTLSFRGIRCRGKPDIVVAEVSQIVHRTPGLRRLVPRVCHEKIKARGNVEFYLFVGHVSTENDDDETTVGAFFDKIAEQHWFGTALPEEFQREQIKTMAGQDVRVEEFARRLRYKPLVIPDAGDPFAEEEDEDLSLSELELTQRFDRLLIWMSAHAEGSFATLDAARRALGIEIDTRRVLRALRLLGHCETSRDGSRWSMAPSAVIQIEEGCFVLAGARDGSLIQGLRDHFPARTEQVPQPSGTGPSTFRVLTADPGDLSELKVTVEQQADRDLARALPSIGGWAEALESVPVDRSGFTSRRLTGDDFAEVGVFKSEAGLYQLQGAGANSRAFHLYYSPELGWRRGEWTGLRFLARLREFGKARCTFDAETHRLFVPFDWRWPEIYERALVLSSGQLPTRDDNGTGAWLVYASVERELLELLQPRLELEVDDA